MPVDDEADVADVRLVEDCVDGIAVVNAALRQALDGRAFGSKLVTHPAMINPAVALS
jgi:hypothetical protein